MPACEICGSSLLQVEPDWALVGRECPRCGEFRIDTVGGGLRADQSWFSASEGEAVVRLSGWIREQNAASTVPTLTYDIIRRIVARPRPDFKTRAMLLLRQIGQN